MSHWFSSIIRLSLHMKHKIFVLYSFQFYFHSWMESNVKEIGATDSKWNCRKVAMLLKPSTDIDLNCKDIRGLQCFTVFTGKPWWQQHFFPVFFSFFSRHLLHFISLIRMAITLIIMCKGSERKRVKKSLSTDLALDGF